MLIRFVWRHCDYERIPENLRKFRVDAFFLEASREEAEEEVFPFLERDAITESKRLGLKYLWNGQSILARPYCFLAARDLSYIFPESPVFPFDDLRNPGMFEKLEPVISVDRLRDIRYLSMPADDEVEMEEDDFYDNELDGESE